MLKPGNRKKKHAGKPASTSNSVHRLDPKKYWENPVYQYLSKRLRVAQESKATTEIKQLSTTIQALISGKLSVTDIERLDVQRKEQAKKDKLERKKQPKPTKVRNKEVEHSTINTSELKKKIFNPQTSGANMIKAFERLPKADQISIAKSLTPFLRSKMGKYLDKKGL